MARFGTEGRARRKYGQGHIIGADFERIVARFQDKGKSDPAWKSRLFNNLDVAEQKIAALARCSRSACPVYPFGGRPCGGPQGYDSHSPDTAFSSLRANPAANRSRFA